MTHLLLAAAVLLLQLAPFAAQADILAGRPQQQRHTETTTVVEEEEPALRPQPLPAPAEFCAKYLSAPRTLSDLKKSTLTALPPATHRVIRQLIEGHYLENWSTVNLGQPLDISDAVVTKAMSSPSGAPMVNIDRVTYALEFANPSFRGGYRDAVLSAVAAAAALQPQRSQTMAGWWRQTSTGTRATLLAAAVAVSGAGAYVVTHFDQPAAGVAAAANPHTAVAPGPVRPAVREFAQYLYNHSTEFREFDRDIALNLGTAAAEYDLFPGSLTGDEQVYLHRLLREIMGNDNYAAFISSSQASYYSRMAPRNITSLDQLRPLLQLREELLLTWSADSAVIQDFERSWLLRATERVDGNQSNVYARLELIVQILELPGFGGDHALRTLTMLSQEGVPLSYLTSLSPQILDHLSPAETSDYIRDHASWVSPGVHVMGALARLAKAGLPLPSGFDLSIYAHEAPSLSMVYLDGPSGGGVAATSYDRAAMHSFLEEYDDVRLAYGNQVETLFLHALLDLDLPSAVITTDVMPRLLAMDPTFRLMNLIHFMRIRGLSPADAWSLVEGLSSSEMIDADMATYISRHYNQMTFCEMTTTLSHISNPAISEAQALSYFRAQGGALTTAQLRGLLRHVYSEGGRSEIQRLIDGRRP